jgi:hypothetical protein
MSPPALAPAPTAVEFAPKACAESDIVGPLPTATEFWPGALAPVPTAVEDWPAGARALVLLPTATAPRESAVALRPTAVAKSPVALASSPTAVAPLIALALVPQATENAPAVAPAPVWGSAPVALPPQTNCAWALDGAITSPADTKVIVQPTISTARHLCKMFGMTPPLRTACPPNVGARSSESRSVVTKNLHPKVSWVCGASATHRFNHPAIGGRIFYSTRRRHALDGLTCARMVGDRCALQHVVIENRLQLPSRHAQLCRKV